MDLIERAENLVPLFRDTAREAELARRPLDHVIEAVRESGLYSLMVPKKFGGHEQDLDTFFDWDGAGMGPADPQCDAPWRNRETPRGCGLGGVVVFALLPLAAARRMRSRRASRSSG